MRIGNPAYLSLLLLLSLLALSVLLAGIAVVTNYVLHATPVE